ncbi:L,D-transpeptidase family protein [Brevundimonas guildfordensis]|uniref:Murein L,D-transpeptidase n=1 Tax=Brevundimonas guildfordensis TaxID=2762241 RepID=A0ABR8QYL0_9CAUL|nr:L,D-transpeptidase [Brevundimonas guildfordensis]MBD7940622.1 murein L,D-transpeptidase [Brevundimonas guildfordensis]
MSKSRLAASALPFIAAALAACGSPAETPKSEPPAAAQPAAPAALTREAVESAVFETAPAPVEGQPARPDAATARAQILLDRANFSPGVIDGLGGDNTRQAIAAFEKAAGLPQDGVLDAEVFRRLTSGDDGRVLTDYTITAADLEGPFIGQVPASLPDMAKLKTVGYATPLEMLAEKFHITEGLLQALNPGVDFGKAGQTIVVAAVAQTDLAADVAHIVVDKAERSVRVYDASDKLLAFYPATIGSSARPAPSGELTVVGVAPEPNYTYDPDRVSYDRGDRKVIVPPGPNNPVGSVWIDLSRDTYGIHGTPDPSKVGKTFSSGCVRLTNWDAEQLASKVKPGVRVTFR